MHPKALALACHGTELLKPASAEDAAGGFDFEGEDAEVCGIVEVEGEDSEVSDSDAAENINCDTDDEDDPNCTWDAPLDIVLLVAGPASVDTDWKTVCASEKFKAEIHNGKLLQRSGYLHALAWF